MKICPGSETGSGGFGRGLGVAVTVVVIVSFFPIMVNAMRGFGATPCGALELMHVLGAGRLAAFIKVRLPFALPHIFAGVRSAATSAILSAMLAEWLSGAPGLGKLILDAALAQGGTVRGIITERLHGRGHSRRAPRPASYHRARLSARRRP